MEQTNIDINIDIPPLSRLFIINILILMLGLAIAALGFGIGSAYVCNKQLEGFLDSDFKCHLELEQLDNDTFELYPYEIRLPDG